MANPDPYYGEIRAPERSGIATETDPFRFVKRFWPPETLGDFRDLILISIGIIYAVGFAVRSAHAFRHGLGLSPAVDAQYLIAGLIPTLVIVYPAVRVYGLMQAAYETAHSTSASSRFDIPLWLLGIATVAVNVNLVILVYGPSERFDSWSSIGIASLWAWAFSTPALLLTTLFLAWVERAGSWSDEYVVSRATYLWLGIAIAAFSVVLYTNLIHRFLPQEFGGGAAACGYIRDHDGQVLQLDGVERAKIWQTSSQAIWVQYGNSPMFELDRRFIKSIQVC